MSMTDPIADMLTRIRNAAGSRHDRVDIPASGTKIELARLMKELGYIANYKVIKDNKQGVLRVYLKYAGGRSVIHGLKRLSTPGRRLYCGKDELPRINHGLGVAIVSTSKGMLTDAQARREGVGGEVMCAIW
ncbi:30S ribosomal protein S8 [Dissulfurirhabdus thermomarina]|uniref:Small ribosomal subunit protein uS8 n=1 Tax=Dissulfurirhabdus thermomarina TaxID=1765737 RepID=A0A6N9TJ90_DISTH|nr:30S ribosomal protein S8 [Dissulfurirhabdus thermomarina]NDY41322.1 30S ribosomal protein S8 [Dissulfurirhabdus thermomarina]NMX23295.1 30S ribosomal protein S8 [Dissulfurirhabdus thermomarina]